MQDCASGYEQQAVLVQQELQYIYYLQPTIQKSQLASSAKKVKVKVPIQEKIEGQSVMQHLLLVPIPLKIGNDATSDQISGETDPELHLRTLPNYITFEIKFSQNGSLTH